MAANQALRDLALADAPWIDVFQAIDRAGLILMLQPFERLYAAYVPTPGGQDGILVNSRHPLSLQRFSAAHELGHFWMRHDESVDTEHEIVERQRGESLAELAANTFAAHFLMPRASAERRISQFDLSASDLCDPTNVYALALSFGVSYSAMAYQLSTLKHISLGDAQRLASVRPKAIKAAILGSSPLENSWADVWQIASEAAGATLIARVGDSFVIRLPSHASGGYVWTIPLSAKDAFEIVEPPSPMESTDVSLVGAARPQQSIVRVNSPGVHELVLEERRPFGSLELASRFDLNIVAINRLGRGLHTRLLPPAAAA